MIAPSISYRLIFNVLNDLFPDHAYLILKCITGISILKSDILGFSTIGITKEGTLLISEKFWDTYMLTKDRLSTGLFHELMHSIGGDLNLFIDPKEDPDADIKNMANNIAMDCRINAYITNTQTFNATEFFESFYNEEVCKTDFLNKLLRPNSIFDNSEDEKKLKVFYDKFYKSDDFCDHSELYELVLEILKKRKSSQKKTIIRLIGTHGPVGEPISDKDLEGAEVIDVHMDKINDPDDQSISPELKEVIIDYLSEISAQGAGKSQQITTSILNSTLKINEKFDLNRFKHLAFNQIFHNIRKQAKIKVGKYAQSPLIPQKLAVGDYLRLASDIDLLLWKTSKYVVKTDKALLPIYLDVSGSTTPYLADIIQLLVNIDNELDYVWGFSNIVHKHSKEDLRERRIHSTGGTDFDCVIDHVVANEFKHIVVLTDGYADCRFKEEKVPGLESVVTILFGPNNKTNYFSRVYQNTYDIEEVKL